MRLVGQSKAGFYPFSNDGVRDIAALLATPEDQRFNILDPCCGEGQALATLAAAVGCREEDIIGMELEDVRVERTRELLPKARIVGPASFLEAKFDNDAVSCVWLNPPYDNEMGGGFRVETSFVFQASKMLATGGVMILVVPERLLAWRGDMERGVSGRGVSSEAFDLMSTVASRFKDWAVIFPDDEHRPYRETILIATKRRHYVSRNDLNLHGDHLPPAWNVSECPLQWSIPAPPRVLRTFEKGGFTEKELFEAIAGSELWRVTAPPRSRPPAEPLLPLSKGHLAMMLASGFLDGIIHPDGEAPHVVRGTAQKEWGDPAVSTEEADNGDTRTIVKRSQKIRIAVRVVDSDGEIRTLA